MNMKALKEAYGESLGGMLPSHIRAEIRVRLDEIAELAAAFSAKVNQSVSPQATEQRAPCENS